MSEVIVLSQSYQPIGKVSVEKAMCLIYLEKAYSIKDSDRIIRTVNKEFFVPIAIVMPESKYVKEKARGFTVRGCKERDNYTCVYCGCTTRAFLTIDHLIPKSRWKTLGKGLTYALNSWENCVTACLPCNQKKSHKLLSELGWPEIKPTKPLSFLEIDWSVLLE